MQGNFNAMTLNVKELRNPVCEKEHVKLDKIKKSRD